MEDGGKKIWKLGPEQVLWTAQSRTCEVRWTREKRKPSRRGTQMVERAIAVANRHRWRTVLFLLRHVVTSIVWACQISFEGIPDEMELRHEPRFFLQCLSRTRWTRPASSPNTLSRDTQKIHLLEEIVDGGKAEQRQERDKGSQGVGHFKVRTLMASSRTGHPPLLGRSLATRLSVIRWRGTGALWLMPATADSIMRRELKRTSEEDVFFC